MNRWKIIWFSIGLGLLYWVVDAVIDVLIFSTGSSLIRHILLPEPLEIRMRFLAMLIIIVFVLFNRVTINKWEKAKEALQQSKEFYNTIPEVIYSLSEDATITSLNPAFEKITGWKVSEWIDKPFMSLIHPDDLPFAIETFQQVLHGETPPPYELRVLSRNGEYLVGEFRSTPIIKDGKVIGEYGIARDITERKKIEDKLTETTQALQSLIKSSPLAIIVLDPYAHVMIWNPAAERIFGWSEEEVVGKFNPIVPEDRKEEFSGFVERVLRGESFTGIEVKRLRKDGTLIDVSLSAAPMYNAKGNVIGAMGILTDITEYKKLQDEIMESENKFRNLFESLTDGVFILDLNGNFIDMNKTAYERLGYTKEEMLSMNIRELDPPEYAAMVPERISQIQKYGSAIFESAHCRKDGSIMPVEVNSKIMDYMGQMVYFSVIRDITERKKAEEQQSQLLDTLAKAKNEWEMTFDNATEFLVLVDKNLNIIRCNKSFADFVGISAPALIGRKCFEVFLCSKEQMKYCKDLVFEENQSEWIEIKTETGKWFYISHRPIFDEKGKFLYTIIIATDITPLKYANEKLIQSEEELKKKVKELEKFYDMAIGRELKMKELKKEIERLKTDP